MSTSNRGRKRELPWLMASFLACATAVGANDNAVYVPVFRPTLAIERAGAPIKIDGNLDDAGWQGAVKAGNFAEHSPGDQTKPEVDTEVWITYDDQHLYVGWLCHDDPSQVRASFCERDRIFSDDYVILCLDTFGEATLAYEIAANPYGIPGDLLFSTSNGEDINYDMVFESAGRITDFGWAVEMAIPFASIRFPDGDEHAWRVDFWRNRPRESRFQYSWAKYDRNESCWPCQWGTVTGISGVKSGAGLELLPAVVAHESGSLDEEGGFANGDVKGEIGLGIGYDVSSELTAEATINPDFSQVESDVSQIDVNTTFAIFYPEKRPFFQEGSDLFDTYFEALYTRSINDPIFGGKMTWRKGSNSVAFLSASDEHSVIILPFEESSRFVENGNSYSNILRARHDFGEQSHVGIMATDRRFDGGGSGSLLGVDGRVRLSQNDAVQFQFLATHTDEVNNPALTDSAFNAGSFDDGKYTAGLDGEKFWGQGAYVGLYRETRSYWGGAEYWGRSPTFRADNGFEPSNSWRTGSVSAGGVIRFDGNSVLENINGDLNAARKWNYENVQKDEWINLSCQVQFRTAQSYIHTQYMGSNELFGGVQFNGIWLAHTCFQTRPFDALSFGGNVSYGHRIARNYLVMGMETNYGLWADIKPIDRFLISTSFSGVTSDDLHTGEWLFSQNVFWSRLSLQVSRELSARLVLQYNDRYDAWDVDPLITYRLNPFSIFYIGSTHNYRDLNLAEDGREGWTLTERQFFVKIQYLFQL